MSDRPDRRSARSRPTDSRHPRSAPRGASTQQRGALAAVGVGAFALLGGWLVLRDDPAPLLGPSTSSNPVVIETLPFDATVPGEPSSDDTGEVIGSVLDAQGTTATLAPTDPEDTWPKVTDPEVLSSLLPNSPPARTRAALIAGVPAVDAKAYVVYDAKRNRIIATKNADARLPVGSVMKLLSARVVLQSGPLDKTVEIPKLKMYPGESKLGLSPGESLTRDFLLRAMLVFSANDAAKSLAIDIAGSEEAFAGRMNAAAATIRLRNTAAKNATGLDATGQYSSANDVLTLSRDLLRSPLFRQVVSRPKLRYHARDFRTTNDLIVAKYPGADGLKTGHTTKAQFCMAASATRDGRQIIVVVLGSKSDRTRALAAKALLDWAFAN